MVTAEKESDMSKRTDCGMCESVKKLNYLLGGGAGAGVSGQD